MTPPPGDPRAALGGCRGAMVATALVLPVWVLLLVLAWSHR